MKLKPIEEQAVVIVGASSGIGRLTALRFAERGARVMVSARNLNGLESLVNEIDQAGGTALAYAADVTELGQMQGLAAEAAKAFGRIDTWVHLAAVSIWAYFEDTTAEEFKQVIDVNLMGQVHGAMAALPYLKRHGGALIHVSSIEGRVALPLQTAYAASKHGLVGFLDSLRLELKEKKIPVSVTNIMPASINTPIFEKARTKLGVQPKGVKPIYPPDIVADTISYAAEHPRRELIAGGAGGLFIALKSAAPSLIDTFLMLVGFKDQQTDKLKSAQAPTNLFGPMDGLNRVEGNLNESLPATVYTRLRMRPTLMWGGLAALIFSAALLGRRSLMRSR